VFVVRERLYAHPVNIMKFQNMAPDDVKTRMQHISKGKFLFKALKIRHIEDRERGGSIAFNE
jgi:hypothetical protein